MADLDNSPNVPGYEFGLPNFVETLRSAAFKNQEEAASYFHIDRTTILRYEKEEGGLRAPLGYLTHLAMIYMEMRSKANEAYPRMYERLLAEVNKAIREEYRGKEIEIRNWEQLKGIATDYVEKKKTSRTFASSGMKLSTSREVPLPANEPPKFPGVFLAPHLPQQGVFGREKIMGQMAEILGFETNLAHNVGPIALRGMGGIGKTTLAIALAYQDSIPLMFPDGVLWTSLGPKPTVRLNLDRWGRALNVDLIPERDEAACQERLRSALYHRRVLLIVDDVWDTIHGKYFQVAGPYCRTVFTTREGPIANDLATRERTLMVNVLEPQAALDLLYKLAPQTALIKKKTPLKLCKKLEFLPLALTLAGRMLANEADVPQHMERVLGELIERGQTRLDLMQTEGRAGLDEENPVSLQAILGMSVERLSKSDQERFAMLSVFGGEPLTWEIKAVSAVWQCSIAETEATISRFIQRGLVEPQGNRYHIHALLADYAEGLMRKMGL
jgi:hypothetical protein